MVEIKKADLDQGSIKETTTHLIDWMIPRATFNNTQFSPPEFIQTKEKSKMEDSAIGTMVDSDLKIVDVIGEGATSIVYMAIDTHDQEYAIKRITKEGLDDYEKASVETEFAILQQMAGHNNIIRLYKRIETECYHQYVLEFCETDLFDAIFSECGLPPILIKEFFRDISSGLHACHENGVYHRDIKPENILVSKDGMAKLADFGLATKDEICTEFGLGSNRYMAPEVFGLKWHPKTQLLVEEFEDFETGPTDIWALGILLLNMITGRNPWHEAKFTDKVFKEYMTSDPHILRRNLKITPELDSFLKDRVFLFDGPQRCTALEFQKFVLALDEFMESEEEDLSIRVSVTANSIKFIQSTADLSNSDSSFTHSSHSSLSNTSALGSSHLLHKKKLGSVDAVSLKSSHKSKPWLSHIEPAKSNVHGTRVSHIASMENGKFKVSSASQVDLYMDSSESRVQLAKRAGLIQT